MREQNKSNDSYQIITRNYLDKRLAEEFRIFIARIDLKFEDFERRINQSLENFHSKIMYPLLEQLQNAA